MEAAKGATKDISVPVDTVCEPCKGTGAEPGTSQKVCPQCEGQGQVGVQRGFFQMLQTCPNCRGEGKIIEVKCKGCRGNGIVKKHNEVTLTIPEGVDTGMNLRLVGKGNKDQPGAPAGNLYVRLQVRPDHFFKRDGADIHTEVPLNLSQAVLGTSIEIPSLTGEVEVKIPAGTQPDTSLVMRNRGVQKLNQNGKGNHYIKLKVNVPSELTPRQVELMEEFQKEQEKKDAEEDESSFSRTVRLALDRVKQYI